jgi:hypothetical protein
MNKQLIIKWGKRIGIAIASAVAMFLLFVLSLYVYNEYYIPYHIESLYQEGLSNPNKAKAIISELEDIEPYSYSNEYKYLQLINHYADKKELWAQILLEQFNEERDLPLNSKIPINKHIWDITLGKSTKQDVWNYLHSKNMWYSELEDGSIIQVQEEFEFAGIYWDYVNIHFTNNKVYKISFVSRILFNSVDKSFNKLKDMLADKYTISKNFSSNRNFSIKDSSTLIELETSRRGRYSELVFKYMDLKEKERKLQQDTDSI